MIGSCKKIKFGLKKALTLKLQIKAVDGLVFSLLSLIFLTSPYFAGAQEDISSTLAEAGATGRAPWDFLSLKGGTARALSWFFQLLGYGVVNFLSIFVALFGWIFDFTLNYTVVEMGTNLRTTEGGEGLGGAINETWRLFRDLANMLLIFVLIYVSITTILQLSSGATKKLLINLVIVGLLINFSLFFTKVIIDSGNYLAVGIYDVLIAPESDFPSERRRALSRSFMGLLKLETLLRTDDDMALDGGKIFSNTNDFGKVLVYAIGASVTLGMVGIVFALGAITLTLRFAMLIVYMITSPIAMVGHILPQTSGIAKAWWKGLISQTFYAPILLLFIWVAMVLITSLHSQGSGAGFLDIYTGINKDPTSTGQALFTFAVAIVMLFMGIILGKKLGNWSGDKISQYGFNMSNKLGYRSGKLGLATTGFAGTRTIGRGAAALDDRLGSHTNSFSKAARFAVTTPLAKTKFGGKRSYSDVRKGKKDAGKERKEQQIKNNSNKFKKAVEGGDATTIRNLLDGSPEFLKHVDSSTIAHPAVAANITASHLSVLAGRHDLKAADTIALGNNIDHEISTSTGGTAGRGIAAPPPGHPLSSAYRWLDKSPNSPKFNWP